MARMVSLLFGTALAAASLLGLTEAVASGSQNHLALQTEFKTVSALHSKTMAQMESHMSVAHAVKVLQSSNRTDEKVMHLLKEHLKNVDNRKLRSVTAGNAKSHYTPTDEAPRDYSGGVESAFQNQRNAPRDGRKVGLGRDPL